MTEPTGTLFIVTGGPGSGKTTLLAVLSEAGFADVSVKAAVPNPDRLSALAALRPGGALTVMVINKIPGTAAVYQLTAANAIKHLANVKWSGGKLTASVPSQSVTLFVLPK